MSESVEETPGQPTQAPATEVSATEVSAPKPADAENRSQPVSETPNQSADESTAGESTASKTAAATDPPASGGPLSLERIRQLRLSQQASQTQSARKAPQRDKPSGNRQSPVADQRTARDNSSGPGQTSSSDPAAASASGPGSKASGSPQQPSAGGGAAGHGAPPASPEGKSATADHTAFKSGRSGGRPGRSGVIPTPEPEVTRSKIAAPSPRQPLSQDMEMELNAALGMSDLDKLLVGDEMLQIGHELAEGQRIQATVMKAHGEHVFVSLGGANEGVVPSLSFETLPEIGAQLDVVVRGYLAQEGLYEVTVSGAAVDVSDWSDLNEGEVIEALVTAANTGGLECKVGNIQGFIPASQAAEYRIENLSDFVGQKLLCVVTEANPRRGNLVLSHRAVLEREKKEKRAERLASIEVGMSVEGVVRKILDFGAFVDIGGLDGLLHVSQLSWERVNHPSEVLEEGQKIQVRIDKIDEATGKIGLSYRSLQDHPWTDIEARFPVGSVVHGSVTRIAEFGAFVRIATGVEGLVHVSELAHHRVQNVGHVVQEGQEVDVKVLSVDADQQRISLSLKAATAAPQPTAEEMAAEEQAEAERPKPVLPKHQGPLKGGTGNSSSGDMFGLKW